MLVRVIHMTHLVRGDSNNEFSSHSIDSNDVEKFEAANEEET